MWLLAPGITAALLAALVLGVCIGLGDPVWQMHDDVEYAMVADGYGLLSQPSPDIPFMHPLVGQAVSGLRFLGARFGYASYLYLCLWLGGAAIAYRFLKSRGRLAATVFLVLGMVPVALLPQYTSVAALLVASAAVLWTAGRSGPPTPGELIFGFMLIFLAVLFRLKMAVLCAACLSPVLVADAYTARWLDRSLAWKFGLGLLALGAGYYLTLDGAGGQRMAEFYRFNDPMADLLNYGYGSALARTHMALPAGYSGNDLDLANNWFFAYAPLVDPATLKGLVNQVPLPQIMWERAWALRWDLEWLPTMMFPWFVLAAVVLALRSRLRDAILGGVALFALADLAIAMLGKPLPERVALGIGLGLFLLAALTSREDGLGVRHGLRVQALTAALLLPVAWIIVADRSALARQSHQFEKDVALLQGGDVIYAWSNGYPKRAGFRPLRVRVQVPPLVSLGTMYLLPQVAAGERARGCGGFVGCLVSGGTVKLLASDGNVRLLEIFFREHFGKSLVTVSKTETPSFTLRELVTKDI